MVPSADIWAQWLLHRRHGGDPARLEATLNHLYPIRDRVLRGARLEEGDTLLDVGCGDGLIGFGALELTARSRVIFSDVSQDLLGVVAELAQQQQVADRCEFLRASAEGLSPVADASVQAVTTRSVLIYVEDKSRAFREFHRVLEPGRRLSIFEPINRFGEPQPPHLFWGYDVGPISEIASKVKAAFHDLQPLSTDPMMSFDERDLIRWAESAGFSEIALDLEVRLLPVCARPQGPISWEAFMQTAANPRIPTIEQVVNQVLTEGEAATFTRHLRPLVETGMGRHPSAVAYLIATK